MDNQTKYLSQFKFLLACLAFVFLSYLLYACSTLLFPKIDIGLHQLTSFFIPALAGIIFLTKPSILRIPTKKMFLKVFLLSLPVCLSVSLAVNLVNHFFPLNLPNIEKALEMADMGKNPNHLFMSLAIIPAISEEFLFRGFLQTKLTEKFSQKASIIIAAAVFTLAHLHPWLAPFYFGLGCFFGWTLSKGKSLWLSVVAHLVNNSIAVGILLTS